MTAKMKLTKPLLVTLATCFVLADVANTTDLYQTEAAFVSSAVQVEIAPTVPKQLCEKIITNTKVRAATESTIRISIENSNFE